MARSLGKIAKYRDLLKGSIDTDKILDCLLAKSILSKEEVDEVKSRPTLYMKNEKLLDIIIENEKEEEFIEALGDANQQHLANYLLNDGVRNKNVWDDWPLLPTQIQTIDVNCGSLKDLIELDGGLLDKLIAKRVISHRHKQLICSKATDSEKNEAFLDILRRGSMDDYENTIQCLRDSNQHHIAEILDEGGVDRASFLNFQKGDLIILDQDNGEMLKNSSWCFGECTRTGQSRDFPAECVYVLPTITKPPPDILSLLEQQSFENSDRIFSSSLQTSLVASLESQDRPYTLEQYSYDHFRPVPKTTLSKTLSLSSARRHKQDELWRYSKEPLKQPLLKKLLNKEEISGNKEKQKRVLPPGEYHRMEKLNELPVEFLQKIFLKAVALHRGHRRVQQLNMASVCSKWRSIDTVMLFSNRAALLIRERNAAAKRRVHAALQQ